MTIKHTPGPWKVDEALDGKPIIFAPEGHPVSNMRGSTICQLAYESGGESYGAFINYEANARLIAAAPDLVYACEIAARDIAYGHTAKAESVLLAAIKKAKGT